MSDERRELDPILKQIIIDLLLSAPVRVETEVEVSRLPRTIDVLVVAESAEDLTQLRMRTLFRHALQTNVIEFKGLNDPLTKQNFANIMGRTYLYMGEHNIPYDEIGVTVICSSKPRNVLSLQLSPHLFVDKGEGIYQNEHFPPVTLVVINELPVTAENYPLLIFASNKKKFMAVMHDLLSRKLTADQFQYVSYALKIRPDVAQELVDMSGIYDENLRILADGIGDVLMPFLPAERRMQGISLQDRMQGITPQDRVQGLSLQDRTVGLSWQEIQAFLRVAEERARWEMLQEAELAEDRISLINDLSELDRAIVLDPDNRDQLLERLPEAEQADLIAWINALS